MCAKRRNAPPPHPPPPPHPCQPMSCVANYVARRRSRASTLLLLLCTSTTASLPAASTVDAPPLLEVVPTRIMPTAARRQVRFLHRSPSADPVVDSSMHRPCVGNTATLPGKPKAARGQVRFPRRSPGCNAPVMDGTRPHITQGFAWTVVHRVFPERTATITVPSAMPCRAIHLDYTATAVAALLLRTWS